MLDQSDWAHSPHICFIIGCRLFWEGCDFGEGGQLSVGSQILRNQQLGAICWLPPESRTVCVLEGGAGSCIFVSAIYKGNLHILILQMRLIEGMTITKVTQLVRSRTQGCLKPHLMPFPWYCAPGAWGRKKANSVMFNICFLFKIFFKKLKYSWFTMLH